MQVAIESQRSFRRASVLALLLTAASFNGGAQVIRVTGIPDENPTELARKNAPLVNLLQNALGVRVTYVPVIDYGAAVSGLVGGKIDFAWLGGFTHVQARIMAGAKPVVMRDIDRQFRSVFIAHAGSTVQKISDCKGKTFAFGAKSSTSGHLMPRYFLMSQIKLDPDKDFAGAPVYSGAHDATVKLVESGKIQCGVLNSEVWDRMSSGAKFDTRRVNVIWTTPDYVDYVWTARKDLAPELVDKFRDAFLRLDPSRPQDRAVLNLQGAQKFVPAAPSDFDAIEKVGRLTGLIK